MYLNATHIGTQPLLAVPFDGAEVFGPSGISTLILGHHGCYDGSKLTHGFDDKQFYGRLRDVMLWNRSLSEPEVQRVNAQRRNLTGSEHGLALFYPLNDNRGSTAKNFGAAGSKYDLVLGGYASGVSQYTSEAQETLQWSRHL